jgi:hypothetical protein
VKAITKDKEFRYFFEDDEDLKKFSKVIKNLVAFLFCIIPSILLISLIHEMGHYYMASLLGWDTNYIHLVLFPFSSEDFNAYIIFNPPMNTPLIESILVMMAGSFHTLLWGYFFFLIYYTFDLPYIIELFCFSYSITMILEMFIYILFDLFFLKKGDWFFLFQHIPSLVFFFLLLGFVNIVLFIHYHREIGERLNLGEI